MTEEWEPIPTNSRAVVWCDCHKWEAPQDWWDAQMDDGSEVSEIHSPEGCKRRKSAT